MHSLPAAKQTIKNATNFPISISEGFCINMNKLQQKPSSRVLTDKTKFNEMEIFEEIYVF